MKRKSLILLLLMTLPVCMMATTSSERDSRGKVRFTALFETRMGGDLLDDYSYGEPTFSTVDIMISPGISFKNGLALRLPIESVAMLESNPNSWKVAGTVGLGLGYEFLKHDKYALEMELSGGSSYSAASWNYAYGQVALRFGTSRYHFNPYIGLGFRYMHSYDMDEMSNKLLTFLALGFSF